MEPLLLGLVVLVVLGVLAGVVLARRGRTPSAPAAPAPRDGLTTAAPAREAGSPGGFRGEGLGAKVRALFGRSGADVWRELETLLLKADVGPRGASDLVARVRDRYADGADPAALLREEVLAILGDDEPLHLGGEGLHVVLVVGVNGSGKTTTIGKLGASLTREGKRVSMAASDTFRAAAGEQLEVWAQRAGAHLVSQDRGADPGAVAFDAVKSATARGADVLLVDTAGRLHTKQPLMEELRKVKRVIEKAGAEVSETLLVLDAQTGQNGIAQARAFTEAVDVTGVVLTKTDGSAKGGVVLAVREELGVPVRYVGVGERPDDLYPFEPGSFADRLLSG
ncbi:MAG: signal recognition particle-docking protein FtsY [Planctomycetaceae bacterium]